MSYYKYSSIIFNMEAKEKERIIESLVLAGRVDQAKKLGYVEPSQEPVEETKSKGKK